ncbi:MAG: hypothetical protein AAGK78_10890 [Planctomycetota bacterium]
MRDHPAVLVLVGLLALLLSVATVTAQRPSDDAAAPEPASADIGRMNALLERMLDADYAVREQARVDLLRLNADDLPALAVALGQQPEPARDRLAVFVEEAVIHTYQREEKLAVIRDLMDPEANRTPAEKAFVERVRARGFVGVGGVRGIYGGPDDELRQSFRFRAVDDSGEFRRGFAIARVMPAFAASEVLMPGDLLLGLQLEDGPVEPAWTLNNVIRLLDGRTAGERVRLVILRGTRLLSRELKLDLPVGESANGNTSPVWNTAQQRALRDATQTWENVFLPRLRQANTQSANDNGAEVG